MSTMAQDTLEKLNAAKNYNRWVFELCCPYLGKRLLETGCGTGNMTELFLASGQMLLATDIDVQRLSQIRSRWKDAENLQTGQWDVTLPAPAPIKAFAPDTILCINMLEHVKKDDEVLRRFYELLAPGGRLLLYVPAVPAIYGSLDRELEHYRRYAKRGILALAGASGFKTEKLHYVNFCGLPGWWLNSRLLQRKYFSSTQITWYDRLIPFLAGCERRVKPPLGQSLFYVGRKA